MKNIMKITGSVLLTSILLATYSCKEAKPPQNNTDSSSQSEVSEEPKENSEASLVNVLEFEGKNMQESFQHYTHIKTALVNGDEAEVELGAQMLMQNTEDEALQTTAKTIMEAAEISAQREAFAELSLQLEGLFKQNLASGTLYKQFCPMALNDEGAFWFSDVKEIRNPYFGNKMLKCGNVVETIN